MNRLSAVLITRNAADVLEPCLDSLAFADEIVLVDSGSSDETVALATGKGARVVQKEWLGFGRQRQFAVEQASHDWVLCVDADERVTPELARSIEGALTAPVSPVYRMARRNRFLGRWLAHGEGYPDWNVRLFDRRRARWSDDVVHEHVVADGPVARLAGDLMHASAESIDAYIAKQNRYTTLQAEALFAHGETGSVLRLAVSPLVRFVRNYALRAGFLDGAAGFAHAAIGAFASFAKHAKLLGLSRRAGEARPDAPYLPPTTQAKDRR